MTCICCSRKNETVNSFHSVYVTFLQIERGAYLVGRETWISASADLCQEVRTKEHLHNTYAAWIKYIDVHRGRRGSYIRMSQIMTRFFNQKLFHAYDLPTVGKDATECLTIGLYIIDPGQRCT